MYLEGLACSHSFPLEGGGACTLQIRIYSDSAKQASAPVKRNRTGTKRILKNSKSPGCASSHRESRAHELVKWLVSGYTTSAASTATAPRPHWSKRFPRGLAARAGLGRSPGRDQGWGRGQASLPLGGLGRSQGRGRGRRSRVYTGPGQRARREPGREPSRLLQPEPPALRRLRGPQPSKPVSGAREPGWGRWGTP